MAWKPTREEIRELVIKYRAMFGKPIPAGGAMPSEDEARQWEIIRECIEKGEPYDESRYKPSGPRGTSADGWC